MTARHSTTQLHGMVRLNGPVRPEVDNAFPFTEQARVLIQFPSALLYFAGKTPLQRLKRSLDGVRLGALHPSGRKPNTEPSGTNGYYETFGDQNHVSSQIVSRPDSLPIARVVMGDTIVDMLDRQAAVAFKLAVDRALYLSHETFTVPELAVGAQPAQQGFDAVNLSRGLV